MAGNLRPPQDTKARKRDSAGSQLTQLPQDNNSPGGSLCRENGRRTAQGKHRAACIKHHTANGRQQATHSNQQTSTRSGTPTPTRSHQPPGTRFQTVWAGLGRFGPDCAGSRWFGHILCWSVPVWGWLGLFGQTAKRTNTGILVKAGCQADTAIFFVKPDCQ